MPIPSLGHPCPHPVVSPSRGVPIPRRARLRAVPNLPEQESAIQPAVTGCVWDFLGGSDHNLADSRDCLEKSRVQPGQLQRAFSAPAPDPELAPLALPSPSPQRGRLGQGLFIDTAPSSGPLPEESARRGDCPDPSVWVGVPRGRAVWEPAPAGAPRGVWGRGHPTTISETRAWQVWGEVQGSREAMG